VTGADRLKERTSRQLLLMVLAVGGFSSLVLAALAGALTLQLTQDQAEKQLQVVVRQIATTLTSYQSLATVQRRVQMATASGEINGLLVLDPAGQVIAASDNAQVGRRFDQLLPTTLDLRLTEAFARCRRPQLDLSACLPPTGLAQHGSLLPLFGPPHLVQLQLVPMALAEGGPGSHRAIVAAEMDLEPLWRQAVQLGLLLFVAGLVLLAVNGVVVWLLVQQRLLSQLLQHAHTDELSGVCNRRAFQQIAAQMLAQAAEEGQEVCLAVIDVDHFKQVNDGHGHGVGDQVIAFVSQFLFNAVRRTDLVGRLGGDEFALLISSNREQALVLLERARQGLQHQSFVLADGTTLPLTLSVGVATTASNGYQLERLLTSADAALYVAKDKGRNRVVDLEEARRSGWMIRLA
jgi:diguanylate cyclase (GGDEF)-like protein